MEVYLIILIIGMILGFMIFFPIVVAPSVFKNFNEKQSSVFLRSFFPKYYLFGIIITIIGIFVSAFEKDFIIQEAAENNDTKYIQSNSKNISQSDLDKFSYMEHPSNIALALDVCKIAGVDKKIAIKGMQKVKRHVRAFQKILLKVELDSRGDIRKFIRDIAQSGIVNVTISDLWHTNPRAWRTVSKGCPSEVKIEEIKDQIISDIQKDKARDKIYNLYAEIEDLRAGGKTLEEIAEEKSLLIESFQNINDVGQEYDGSIIRNPSLQELINLIFTNDTGEDLEPY